MIERQELYCHECQKYVEFDIDLELNGNHVLNCPNCGHEHCRVVKDGVITDDRWDSRNIPVSYITATYSAMSTYTTYTSSTTTTGAGTQFLYGAWLNTTTDTI